MAEHEEQCLAARFHLFRGFINRVPVLRR
jgi:hypothetical protein